MADSKGQPQQKDHWSHTAYTNAASFVPKLTSTVQTYLAASPGDHILDLGCGDGQLTSTLSRAVGPTGHVLGLDASPSFIATAKEAYKDDTNTEYVLQDCTKISECADVGVEKWDKIFSNAALHWILRAPSTRATVFEDAYRALKPAGKLVFEMGGKGNVAEIHAAFLSALVHAGVSIGKAREACPWFFPSCEWMRACLEGVGFGVEVCEREFRPTKCTEDDGGKGGLEGWLWLMGAQFLDVLEKGKRAQVVEEARDVLESVVTREEDGSRWIGYVRLRVVAVKK